MDQQQILDLYTWGSGVCFRHPGEGEQPTTVVGTIHPPAGGIQDVRACEECVLQMERERRAAASLEGVDYEPGRAGETLR